MTDIVERLRLEAHVSEADRSDMLMREAADEIERLRAAFAIAAAERDRANVMLDGAVKLASTLEKERDEALRAATWRR